MEVVYRLYGPTLLSYLINLVKYPFFRVGGSIPVVWTYFAEFQPAKYRGGALSFLASFWMVNVVFFLNLRSGVIFIVLYQIRDIIGEAR